ncbi:RagB/SusD family nutrient uptake outer membrane protein [Sphingobacterium sp. PCS056]|uniref:RagB/SusD family nutrient uptake outer membrane protein n=1 Tax=Sphingobacterium sp. PCS056 TaxID=2931400 RepID=UPI00200EC3BC|nr:RagB/SusD family nutrient uptake outer membrane protein [Sphingobacterium sp. PCS056]UPZ36504.1 RagB/SusD family nutrient uptake outer membrane protein [Sphingobacterium sp. PCS056]
MNEKPTSSIAQPTKISDFQDLLENTTIFNLTGALTQIGADDLYLTDANWETATATERNAYIWNDIIYDGDQNVSDWNIPYSAIFHANVVLEGLEKNNHSETETGKYTRAWALYARAFAYYDLIRTFCPVYNETTASTDLGVPIRLSPNIDYLAERSSLKDCMDLIINDLQTSLTDLPKERPGNNLNRPWKNAVYALLSRIYLDLRNYEKAEFYADQSLTTYKKLMDYKTLNKSASNPFTFNNEEIIYFSRQVIKYPTTTINTSTTKAFIAPELIALYKPNDTRKPLYFRLLTGGYYGKKIGYQGSGNYHFSGLATDEIFLIKAECLARRNEVNSAMNVLNELLVNRWDATMTNPALQFTPLTATNKEDALNVILEERRKELVWRALRWQDLRRLNAEGYNKTLTRNVKGISYSIAPNSLRYIMPIPDEEIILSGIKQNQR